MQARAGEMAQAQGQYEQKKAGFQGVNVVLFQKHQTNMSYVWLTYVGQ